MRVERARPEQLEQASAGAFRTILKNTVLHESRQLSADHRNLHPIKHDVVIATIACTRKAHCRAQGGREGFVGRAAHNKNANACGRTMKTKLRDRETLDGRHRHRGRFCADSVHTTACNHWSLTGTSDQDIELYLLTSLDKGIVDVPAVLD